MQQANQYAGSFWWREEYKQRLDAKEITATVRERNTNKHNYTVGDLVLGKIYTGRGNELLPEQYPVRIKERITKPLRLLTERDLEGADLRSVSEIQRKFLEWYGEVPTLNREVDVWGFEYVKNHA